MKKLLIILCGYFFLLLSCNSKMSLRKNDLVGYCGMEIVNLDNLVDTSIIEFVTQNKFIRHGEMYIQSKGKYEIVNDTIIIYYFCKDCSEQNTQVKPCCAKQLYIMEKNGDLRLIRMIDGNGNEENINKSMIDLNIEKINCIEYNIQ